MSGFGNCKYVRIIFSVFRKRNSQKAIARSSLYKKERKVIRKDVLLNEKVCIVKKQLMILEYYIRVRWRAHISTYLHKSIIPSGLP